MLRVPIAVLSLLLPLTQGAPVDTLPTTPSRATSPDCVKGICQTTTVAEVEAGIGMNLLGPAQYFWQQAGTSGTFTYAGDTKAYAAFDQVKAQLSAMPEAFRQGKIFKPNDLGLLRLNNKIFSYAPNPAIALSMSTAEHAIVRPVAMAMFANTSEWSVDTFTQEAATFFADMKKKGSMTQGDIGTWNQRMLHKYGLKHEISNEEAAAYQAYGLDALKNAILPDGIFNTLTEKVLKTSDVRTQNADMRAKYGAIAKKRCPFLKSDDDVASVAHGLVDGALTFAGGLSIPSLITSMLGVLYSGKHGDFSQTYNTPAFLWETVRVYPAVVGVPFAQSDTTQREAVLLPAALTDKAVWGEDAFDFKLRDESLYSANIDVAWAGFASSTAHPNDSHSCPGGPMSKAIMLGFMRAFKNTEWKASTTPKVVTHAPVAWNGFSLKAV